MILGKYTAKPVVVAKAGNLRRFDEDKPVITGVRIVARSRNLKINLSNIEMPDSTPSRKRFAGPSASPGATATID
jgi:hypothetical protein